MTENYEKLFKYDDEIHHTVNSYNIANGGHSFPFFSFPYEL